MKDTHHFLAFDLGATSGRSMLGTLHGGRLELAELTRFPNAMIRIGRHDYWNIYSLYEELKRGLEEAGRWRVPLDALGIDTWGVDFVCVASDGTFLGLPRSYRDPYTAGVPEAFFRQVPAAEVYAATGIQTLDFNTLFQLYAARREGSSALEHARSLLFMPDVLAYLLTGRQVCEYTIASTSQLLNPHTRAFEPKLFAPLGLAVDVMPELVMPGTVVGALADGVCRECGVSGMPVVAVAGHDTASAVAAVPAEGERFAYLSSGTWSLMGIEVPRPIITDESRRLNFTNEGGVEGTTRFLKNITGMWLLEQCRREWRRAGADYPYPDIVSMAQSAAGFRRFIDPDHPSFARPDSMTGAICAYCRATGQPAPETPADFIRCIFDSLAMKYRYVLDSLQRLSPFPIERLHVIGGGSQNGLLNRFTANATGLPVVAGPVEATATGNVLMQAKAVGAVGSLADMRAIVRSSVSLDTYLPEDTGAWAEAYGRYRAVTGLE